MTADDEFDCDDSESSKIRGGSGISESFVTEGVCLSSVSEFGRKGASQHYKVRPESESPNQGRTLLSAVSIHSPYHRHDRLGSQEKSEA